MGGEGERGLHVAVDDVRVRTFHNGAVPILSTRRLQAGLKSILSLKKKQ